MLMYRENGRPRSRAKDQVIREAAAKQPSALQNSRTMIMLVITVAPSFEPTVARKIWIMGNPVAFLKIVARFGTLNNTAKSMPRARQPLMARPRSIEQATSVLAFFTSSDIFRG